MLCPEVWNFEAPESSFQIEKLDYGNLSKIKNINNFYYNHLVSVTLPDSLSLPDNLFEKLVLDCEYYKVSDLNIVDLLNVKFRNCFVKNGNLTLLSINTRIDCDNCIGVTPEGQLILSVDKETYQKLGLDGKLSHFTSKIKNRYIIAIDLQEDWNPEKSKYIKIKSRLQALGKFTVIISWEPPVGEICPSSAAKYFFDLGYNVKVNASSFTSNTLYSVKVPEINFDNINKNNIIDFVEWLGMISIEGDLEVNDPGNYHNSYVTPEPNKELGPVKYLQWRGFFTTTKIKELVKELIKYNNSMSKAWFSVYVQGFSDSPVAWGIEEHHYYTNGDSGYIILINNENSLLCTQKCSKKRYK